MLKKSILAVAALGVMHVANAQTVDSLVSVETRAADKHLVETNHFGSNWFIGAQIGVQHLFADFSNSFNGDNWKEELAKGALAFDVNFGKWFTPGIGVRFGVAGMNVKGNAGIGRSHNGAGITEGFIVEDSEHTENGHSYYDTNIKYLRGHADVMFNLSQMILGYEQNRFYSFIPYASIGYAGSLNKPNLDNCSDDYLKESDKNGTQSFTVGVGLINRFHISKRLDINLDLNLTALTDRFDGQHGGFIGDGVQGFRSRYDGIGSAAIGLSYDLGANHWHCSTVTTTRVNENALNDLREKVSTLELTNDDLRQQLEDALGRDVTPENVCGMPLLITFPIDRWMLCHKGRVNLGFLAEAIKANPKMVYKVTGFADKGTGSVRRNVFLAKKRAEVIYNCLVKEFGVPESQLIKESKGGVGNMYYNDPRCSRGVLLKLAE